MTSSGAGVWHPAREGANITAEEKAIAEYEEHEGGVRMWCAFNSSLNSSTRCELGAAILAMLAPRPLNIGIDNATVVLKGNEIIEHLRKKEIEEIRDSGGDMMLGGTKSRLQRSSP